MNGRNPLFQNISYVAIQKNCRNSSDNLLLFYYKKRVSQFEFSYLIDASSQCSVAPEPHNSRGNRARIFAVDREADFLAEQQLKKFV